MTTETQRQLDKRYVGAHVRVTELSHLRGLTGTVLRVERTAPLPTVTVYLENGSTVSFSADRLVVEP